VVMGSHMLHPELTAGVSGAAHVHSLQAEDIDFDEVAGCQLLKSGPVPSPLSFVRFHQSPSFISLGYSDCNILNVTYNNYSSSSSSRGWKGPLWVI